MCELHMKSKTLEQMFNVMIEMNNLLYAYFCKHRPELVLRALCFTLMQINLNQCIHYKEIFRS